MEDVSDRCRDHVLTTKEHGHVLTNLNVWTPDSGAVVYDTRSADDRFDGIRIEEVDVVTGQVRELFRATGGAHCGAVTCAPDGSHVVFILGPEHPTPDWTYGTTRRCGWMVSRAQPGAGTALDAEGYAPPFVAGVLRGGSHVHVFSPDGTRISFTYEDEVLAQLDARADAPEHDPNQRNVGVALLDGGPVRVPPTHPRSHDGSAFSVLVTRTVAKPRPGSDEISRAFEEGWVGTRGYRKPDGSWQQRALAFQGRVVAADGREHAEVFIVDLPDDLRRPGAGPLAGTTTRRPAPPADVRQRRLTFTDTRERRGLASVPRHWLRCAPDGSAIAFLLPNEDGAAQLWTVSPNGGPMHPIGHGAPAVASTFTWSPDGRWIACIRDGSVCATEVASGRTLRLTARRDPPHDPQPYACVFAPDGRRIAYTRRVGEWAQVCVVEVGPDLLSR
ncbi:DUF3748 domain-containing protein [Opitutus sp. ER46]|uniref:DUF3748 domain-containing protein n=1 Tax=Opitutus sp. ER46 TaxID=2161864 RepID=UPI000D30E5F3|nr:biopolymer transporter Tol [Opitutus sp. ER46]